LVEYNFNRPHQSLVYLTPVEYIEKELAKTHSSVLPMWSASTRGCTPMPIMLHYTSFAGCCAKLKR
ncbi:MAG: hypothetical protein J7L19_00485, partial [Dehalococcoidia bacterium]|nr:hypothetical protein [Dehalococcoidia bacterium]